MTRAVGRPITCHVCAELYERGNICPTCGAPRKVARDPQALAKDLLDARARGEGVRAFFSARCRAPAEVDACLAILPRLDFDAWERGLRTPAIDPDQQPIVAREIALSLQAIASAREELARGVLLPAVNAEAEEARQDLAEERARHLALKRAREGG